mgnify:CR=1 FL=1
MRIRLRVDVKTPKHVHFTVFVNEGYSGKLILRKEEFDELVKVLNKSEIEFEVK